MYIYIYIYIYIHIYIHIYIYIYIYIYILLPGSREDKGKRTLERQLPAILCRCVPAPGGNTQGLGACFRRVSLLLDCSPPRRKSRMECLKAKVEPLLTQVRVENAQGVRAQGSGRSRDSPILCRSALASLSGTLYIYHQLVSEYKIQGLWCMVYGVGYKA